jgi:hypothetical protein
MKTKQCKCIEGAVCFHARRQLAKYCHKHEQGYEVGARCPMCVSDIPDSEVDFSKAAAEVRAARTSDHQLLIDQMTQLARVLYPAAYESVK